MAQLVQLLQPAVDQYGSHLQLLEVAAACALLQFRRSRYVFSDALVEERAALEHMWNLGDPIELATAQFGYGFALLWNGRLEQAGTQLRAAIIQARQTGLVLLETQCLVYLAIIARLRGQLEKPAT